MGEVFAGLEKLGLAPKFLQNPKGSAEPFFNRLFPMQNVLQSLPAEAQRFCRILRNLGEAQPVLSAPANASPNEGESSEDDEDSSPSSLRVLLCPLIQNLEGHSLKIELVSLAPPQRTLS